MFSSITYPWISLSSPDRESAPAAIIPGLPDDLALSCLARISHGYHGLLECVSKRWRDAVRSLDYARIKSQKGWCGDWLFILTDNQEDSQWNAYDPEVDRWHPLPCYPNARRGYSHLGFSCVSVNNRLLVIGGYHAPNGRHILRYMATVTNAVMQFDPFTKQWNKVASMRTERADFACAVVCGKVYVGGGWNSSSLQLDVAEVYDPLEDRWEDLPPLPMLRKDCFGVSYEGHFHVIRRKKHRAQRVSCRVFDPLDKRWKRACTTVMPFPTMAVGECFFTVDEGEGNSVKTRMKDQDEWKTLGKIPPVVLPDHSRPLECFGYSLTGLGSDLYVLGGRVLKWNESRLRFDIVKLDLVRFCNVTAPKLNWRATRRTRLCGAVLACASIKE
ncbi:hypothetical protein ACLOJK_015805 [Asimina triloba]